MATLSEIVGQESIIKRLRDFANFFRAAAEVPDHILIVGGEGMGRRTIAEAFAGELAVGRTFAVASQLEKKGDLTAILTSLDAGQVLILEDIQRLRQNLRDIFILALRDFRVDLIIGQGPGTRVHPYRLHPFTCVSSVQREADITTELRDIFPLILRLQPYSTSDLAMLAVIVGKKLDVDIDEAAAGLIAAVSKKSPREVEVLIRRLAKTGKSQLSELEVQNYLSAVGFGFDIAKGGHYSLDSLSGPEFEKLIAALLARMGFQVEMTRATGDGGIDIIATLNKPIIGGRVLVQCKRFAVTGLVGAPLVREFYGALKADQGAVKGIFVTTSSFTAQAREFASSLPIELIDREKLQAMLHENGL